MVLVAFPRHNRTAEIVIHGSVKYQHDSEYEKNYDHFTQRKRKQNLITRCLYYIRRAAQTLAWSNAAHLYVQSNYNA